MYGAYVAGKQGEYQEDINRYAAQYSKAVQRVEEAKIQRQAEQIISAQRAQTAASGFTNEGTPLELQVESRMMADLDTALLRQAGGIERMRLRVGGTMARAEGYGMSAGLSARAFGTMSGSLLSYGGSQGWFSGDTKAPEPSYPRNFRSFG
jgi:hypothetical protein